MVFIGFGSFKSEQIYIDARFDSGHANIVEIFLRNGANVNVKVVDGKTALYLAALNGITIEFFESIIKYSNSLDSM